MKVLFLSNIPAPYRIDFFNALGKHCELTVVFEAKRAEGIRFNWNEDTVKSFRAVFLNEGEIDETHVDRRMMALVKRGEYDYIVATSYGYYTETAAILKMRLLGIPYLIEIDGGVVRARENRLKYALKRCIIRGAGRLLSSGEATDAVFLHYGADAARIRRYPFTSLFDADILPAVPGAEEKNRERAALHIAEGRVVLSVGQFIRRKGYDVLLNHAGGLADGTRLLLIGGEPTDEYRAILTKKGLTNVTFLPFCDKETLNRYYRAADVFVLPTREDMWGLVVNEAMANGLPVVTTENCNAGRELIRDGENGYLVPVEDGDTLIRRTNEILLDEERRGRMAKSALTTARAYTIEAMVRTHLAVFREDRD